MGISPRVTHPCASFRRTEVRLHLRLACVKPAASVRSEPGSNSHVQSKASLKPSTQDQTEIQSRADIQEASKNSINTPSSKTSQARIKNEAEKRYINSCIHAKNANTPPTHPFLIIHNVKKHGRLRVAAQLPPRRPTLSTQRSRLIRPASGHVNCFMKDL